ncbi:hypothetical protein J517_1532 [Acinetobacter baumannii 118362]|nr:hypothetical protein J517_1532 [Acinetobacter baumannii 118362]
MEDSTVGKFRSVAAINGFPRVSKTQSPALTRKDSSSGFFTQHCPFKTALNLIPSYAGKLIAQSPPASRPAPLLCFIFNNDKTCDRASIYKKSERSKKKSGLLIMVCSIFGVHTIFYPSRYRSNKDGKKTNSYWLKFWQK